MRDLLRGTHGISKLGYSPQNHIGGHQLIHSQYTHDHLRLEQFPQLLLLRLTNLLIVCGVCHSNHTEPPNNSLKIIICSHS